MNRRYKGLVANAAIYAAPHDQPHQDALDRPCGEPDGTSVRREHLEPVTLDTDHRTPPPLRRLVRTQRFALELGDDVVGDDSVALVAGGTAQRVGRGDVADREDTGVVGDTELGGHADEAVLVEQFARQPAGVGAYAADRPQHRVGSRGRLTRAPLDGIAGD